MRDQGKTREQLIDELVQFRERVKVLENADLEHRRVEEELAKSKAMLTAAVECLPFDLFALAPDGRCILQNAVSRQYYGDALGKTTEDVCPDEGVLARWLEKNRRAFAGERVAGDVELAIRGEQHHFHNIITPIRDGHTVYGILGVNVEMTQQKRAEKALRESEERYRFLSETVPHPMWRCHANGEVIEFNGRWYEYTGQTPDEAKGEGWMKALHPDDRERVSEQSRQVAAAGGVFEAEYRLRRRDGSYRWHLARSLPMKDQDGQVIFRFGSATDIDDQKRAEEALRESELRYRALAESTRDIIYILDRQGTLLYANQAASRCIGIPCDEIVGKRQTELFPPEMAHNHVERIERVFATGEVLEQDELFHFGPEEVWLRVHLLPLRDEAGRIASAMGVCHNITDRKRAEEILRESEERYRLLAEAIPHPVWRSDAEGMQIDCNRRWQEYTGQTPEEAQGTGWMKALHPDDVAWAVQRKRDDVAGGKLYRAEYRLRRASDGSYRWHLAQALPMKDKDGKILAWFGSATDIEDQKRAQEVLQKAHDELERRVEERTAELAKANENLDIFRKFAEASGEGFGMADLDGRIVYVNPMLCRLFGEKKPQDVIGKNVSAYYPKEYVPWRKDELIPALLREEHPYIEQTILPRSGKPLQTLQNTFPIRDGSGNPFRTGVVISDITERKQAEEAVRRSERRFRNYFDQGLIGMAVTSVDKSWLEVNDRLCEIMGYSREELLRKNWAELTHPDDLESNLQFLNRLLAGEIEHFTLDKRFLRKDQSIVYTTIHIRAFRNEDGSIDHIVALTEDITAGQRAEEALEREKRTLQHMLRASDHERQLIAYEIHDGLAQELAAAIMQFDAFEYLKETKPKQAADAFHAAMTMLRQGHFEARRLISGVRPPILDEQGVVEAIAHLVHEQAHSIGPKIKFDSEVDFGRLAPTLENAIYRITQEGLTNACKHSKSEKVRVNLVQHGDRVRIEIRDWGVGFDPQQVSGNRFGVQGIRQRARLLGGKYSIQSATGKGTRILVELPVVERESEE